MYNRFNYILILLILLIATSLLSYADIKTATLNIKANNFHKDTANKEILGGFYEQLADFVLGPCSFYAEELVDRGFDNILFNDSFPQGKLANWDVVQKDSSKVWIIWSGGYNKNGLCGLLFDQKNNSEASVSQKFVLSDSNDYDYYFYAKNLKQENGQISVKIIGIDNFGKRYILAEEKTTLDSNDWKKYSLKLPIKRNYNLINNKTEIIISADNNSNFMLDEVSLMPDDNVKGVRKEQYDLFKKVKFGTLRYPGGWFADTKDNIWKNELLVRDQRRAPFFVGENSKPQRVEFGLLDYIHFCRDLNITPYLTVNLMNGTPEEAAELVEFCNSDTNSYYGRKRMELGDTLPYNVKYWEIGNEQWNDKNYYANRYLKYYDRMMSKDSTIITIINGNSWDPTSFDSLMNIVKSKCTLFGYHTSKGIFLETKDKDRMKYLYTVDASSEKNVIEDYKKKIEKFNFNPKLILGNTEWWSNTMIGGWISDKFESNAEFKAGLWSNSAAMIYLNYPDLMKIGTRTMGIGFIKREIDSKGKKAIYGTPAYHGFAMLTNHFAPNVHKYELNSETYFNHDPKLWINESPYIEVLSTSSKDTLFLTILNRYPDEIANIEVKIDNKQISTNATKYELWSEDYNDMNTPDEPNKIVEKVYKNVSINKNVILKPHSFNIFAIPIEYKNGKLEINTIDLSVDDDNSLFNDLSSMKFNIRYKNNNKHIEIASEIELKNISVEVYSSTGELVSNNNYFNFDKVNFLNANLLSGAYYVKISNSKNDFVMLPLMVIN